MSRDPNPNAKHPKEVVVHDAVEACPYLEGETARMPLRFQVPGAEGSRLDELLALGDRRVGRMMYRPTCPHCTACEAVRVPVRDFVPTRSQRRAVRKNADVRISWHRPTVTDVHLDLYNRHKLERDLSRDGQRLTVTEYYHWLVNSCTDTREARYWLGDELIGVGIVDVGDRSSSSVYFYFDPDHSRRSLGVFSVLKEVEYAALEGRDWHYLGLYVADCQALNYKSLYLPHERLIDGEWRRFSLGER